MKAIFYSTFFILFAVCFFNNAPRVEAGDDISTPKPVYSNGHGRVQVENPDIFSVEGELSAEGKEGALSMSKTDGGLPFAKNEVIKYKVKLRGITIGRASLTYKGITELDGKKVHLIVFCTDTANFKDEEKMYASLDDFLPIRIERNVNNWGKKEYIIEEYDQQNYSVKITWVRKKGNKTKIIQQDGKIQNVILSTFLHRKLADLKIDKSFSVILPLRKVEMRVTRKERIRVYTGTYDTYRLESFPGRHKIWFELSSRAIPVRISGPFFLGSVNMMMIDYSEK